MKISPEQRKALEAAGYTVSSNGQTVKTKDGGSVGGYNENGKVWSGSNKVRDILKGKGAAAPAPAKAEAKPASRPRREQAPASSPRPKARPEAPKRDNTRRSEMAGESGPRRANTRRSEMAGESTPRKASGVGAAIGAAALAGAAAIGGAAARKKARDAQRASAKPRGTAYNPSYTGKAKMPEGPQGRYATGVGRPRGPSAAGAALNPARGARRLAGGRMNSLDPRNNPYRLD